MIPAAGSRQRSAFETVPARLSGALSMITVLYVNIPDDLSRDEWAEAVTAMHEGGGELGDDTIVVRSHLWPQVDGTYDWVVLVPGTDHRAEGNETSIKACYETIDEKLVEWYPEAADPNTRMTVGRMIPEVTTFQRPR